MGPERQAPEAEYDSSGVDVTLIRWMLSMTPAERLETLQSFVDSVWQFMGDGMKSEFASTLRVLAEHGVEFLIVGGVGAVLLAATVTTFDLHIVHRIEPVNIARLLVALKELDAYYRAQPERRLRPNESHLSSPGHQLLMTRFGPLDVLGAIGKGRRYEQLLPHATEMETGPGLRVRVLDLATLIAVKEETGQEKDLAVLPVLRRVLEESRRQGKI